MHLAAVLLLVLGGCGEAPEAGYDRFRLQLVGEVFEAAAREDAGMAVRQAQRLQAAFPDFAFPQMLLEHEKARVTLTSLEAAWAQGDLNRAAALLAAAGPPAGAAAGSLGMARRRQAALEALQGYLRRRPFANADGAAQAWEQLAGFQTLLASAPDFAAWAAAEAAQLRELRRLATAAEAARLLQACDQALASGTGTEFDSQAGKLAELLPEHALPQFLRLLSGPAVSWPRFAEQDLAAFEIAALRRWPALSNAARESVAARIGKQPAATLSGWLLRSLIAGVRGAKKDALDLALQAGRQVRLGKPQVAAMLTAAVLPADQFAARPWRPVFPAFTDIVNRVSHFRENLRNTPPTRQ